jgi:type I restriction enzyme S subunit
VSKSTWTEVTLGQLVRIKHGFAFKGEYFGAAGTHVVLTPGNFHEDGGFRAKEGKEKWYFGPVPPDYVLSAGALIVAMTEQADGLLGSSAFVPKGDFYLHNQRLGLVEPIDAAASDKRFLYYLFNSRSVRQQIRASANGAKIRHTSPSRMYEIKVKIPGGDMQRRIASILSAYDDLIEKNTRRIAILEEMARRIYEEWFVRFRFPGYKNVRMVESELGLVPEGWRIAQIGDLVDEVRDAVSPHSLTPDTPYVGLEHIPRRSIALAEWGHAAEVQSTKLQFREGDILFGKIRPYFHKVAVAPLAGVASSDAIVIRPKNMDTYGLALAVVSSDAFVAEAAQTSNGTKMPRANWNVLQRYVVAIPPDALRTEFEGLMTAVVSAVGNHVLRNRNLRSTRDILLPKLISGELDVSAMPEPEPAAA